MVQPTNGLIIKLLESREAIRMCASRNYEGDSSDDRGYRCTGDDRRQVIDLVDLR